jgi:hypothetical protein
MGDGKYFNENAYVFDYDSDYQEWLHQQEANKRKVKPRRQVT